MTITDLYRNLFGKSSIRNGDVIGMAEHGRAGGISTGTPFKMVRDVEEKTIIDEVNDSTAYVGRGRMGANTGDLVWQIKKLTTVSTITTIEYADGNDNYDNEWDERTNLNYS